MQITVKGLDKLEARLSDIARRQLPFAVAKTLNDTLYGAIPDEKKEMEHAFDRPTPYALNAMVVVRATKQDLTARLQLKEPGRLSEKRHFLHPQIYGGAREPKRMETLLRDAGVLPRGKFVAPAAGAKLDRYGNISGPQITQLLSNLGAIKEMGFQMNRTANSSKRATTDYFIHRVGGNGVPMGIWQRGRGARWARPVLQFISRPQYKKRFKFHETSAKTIKRDISKNFSAAWAYALRTAK